MDTLNVPLEILIGHKRYDDAPSSQYIGRGSPLGNPFRTKERSKAEHDRVVREYKIWLWQRIQQKDLDICKELTRLKKLLLDRKHLELLCYCRRLGCSGLPCHGDILRSCLQWMINNNIDL